MTRRARWAAGLIAAAAAIVIVALVAAPLVLARRLQSVIAHSLAGTPEVHVQLETAPWRLWRGSVSAMRADVGRAQLGQVPVDRMTLHLRDVEVSLPAVLRGEAGAIRRVGSGDGEILVSREDMERFLDGVKGIRHAAVQLEAGLATIEGDVSVGSLDLRVRLEGRLVVASPTAVDLYVQTLTVSGVQIPKEIGGVLASSLNPLLALEGFPVPLRIESVAVDHGQVRMVVRVGETS